MRNSMLKQEIKVHSEKYGVDGVVKDYGVVTKLFFSYGERDIEMAIDRNPLTGESFETLGQSIIDSYIDNLAAEERKIKLHYWYIDEQERGTEKYRLAHGICTGHPRLSDAMKIHTSNIQALHTDLENEELVVNTMNTEYHCPLAYCRWEKQDEYAHLIPEYEKLKETYKDQICFPSIEPGKVLLVLANFCEYYFHSLYYVPEDSEDGRPCAFQGYPHIGTFQDSYLISTEGRSVDLRYFPHSQNIEFYSENTEGKPFFMENIGDAPLYAKTSAGTIRLAPGERREVKKENAEEESPVLPGGDLYPAGIIE